MKIKMRLLLAVLLVTSHSLFASELKINLEESEVKEDVARSLGVNAQQIEIYPAAIEYAQASSDDKDGVNLKGRLFITWSVRDVVAAEGDVRYSTNGVTISSKGETLDGNSAGNIIGSVKLGYQFFDHLGMEMGYEKSTSTMEVSTLSGGLPIGTISSIGRITNEFQTVKLGLTTNANLINAKSFRMDLVGGINGGMVMVDSTYRSKGDVYSGAIGYSYGAEVGIRVVHKSGFFLQTGVGMNNKVLAPKSYNDGSSSSFNSNDKYVFVNVGFSFGGGKRK